MTQLADTPDIPRATDGVPLTREERAYLRGLPSPDFPAAHPVHAGADAALAEWEAREDRRRELVRRYRTKGVLPDDWDIRITWIRMDPRSYYAIQRAARAHTRPPAVSPPAAPVEPLSVAEGDPVPRRTWRQHLTRALHALRY